MVSLNKVVYLFLTSLVFISKGCSQVCAPQRVCGPTTMTPTGPVVPTGQFVIPAIIKPLLSACQPAPTAEQPLDPASPAPCDDDDDVDDDDNDTYDTLMFWLIKKILDSKKYAGKKNGNCKNGGYDGGADACAGDAGCAGDGGCYTPAFCPYGGADGAGAPEFALTFRSLNDAC